MKALCLVVKDKKIFESCILKPYFLTPWPTYATNQNHLNNFGRGLPRDHSCWVWSNNNKRFKIKVIWSFPYIIQCKIVTPGQGHFVLRWAKRRTTKQVIFSFYVCFIHIKPICAFFSTVRVSQTIEILGLYKYSLAKTKANLQFNNYKITIF